jgi:hypothetical protein
MNKTTLVICSWLRMTGLAQAQSVSQALINCSKELDSLKRLVCYDRLTAGLNSPGEQTRPQEARTSVPQLKSKALTSLTPASPKVAEQAKVSVDKFCM